MTRRLFIGVVTHGRSRFHESAVAQLAVLADAGAAAGWEVETLVSDRDDYDPEKTRVDRRVLMRSSCAQAALEYRWRRYLARAEGMGALAGGVRWVQAAALLAGTATIRTARYLSPWPGAALTNLHGTRAVIRLLNIDLSHLRVLRAGVASGADWILILEDDAQAAPGAISRLLPILAAAEEAEVSYVTASRSIDHDELGIDSLLEPAVDGHRCARVPVTNTVCAVAYRRGTGEWFADRVVGDGLVPVIPIDWRLNRAVMAAVAQGRMGRGSCWVLEPALFTQGSMH